MSFTREDIWSELAPLRYGETDGEDPLTAACLYHVERWEAYEAERREAMEASPAYAAVRREQWARANAKRKRKRRGLHLSNAERARWADLTSAGVMSAEDVSRETGVSVATAERIAQLSLEGVA